MHATLRSLTDRIDRLPVSAFHFRVLIVAALSLFFDTLDTVVTGFVLAELRSVWQLDARAIGVISAIGLGGYLVGSFASGFIADYLGRKKTILYTLVLYSLFSASRGLSTDVYMFSILNFFTWVFVGAESSVVPPYLAELWPSRVRGKLNGWMMLFFALGVSLSPLYALYVIPQFGWKWALFLTLPFALLGGFMRSGLPESPRWLVSKGKLSEAELVVKTIEDTVAAQTGGTLPPVKASPSTAAAAPATLRDLLGPRFRSTTIMLWCAWFAQYGVLYTFLSVLPTVLALEGFSVVKSFQFSLFIYAAFVPAYVLGGYIVEWFDRKYAALGAYFCAALFGTLFGLSSEPSMFVTFGALTAFALGIGATFIYTYTPELYPTEIRATGMGIASAWGRVGGILLLLAFGIFAVLQGKLALFLVSDGMLAIAFFAVLFFGPSTRGKTLEQTSGAA
jgi:putative MFS transporter